MDRKTEFLYVGNIIRYEEDGMGSKLLINDVFQDKHTLVTQFGASIKGKIDGRKWR